MREVDGIKLPGSIRLYRRLSLGKYRRGLGAKKPPSSELDSSTTSVNKIELESGHTAEMP